MKWLASPGSLAAVLLLAAAALVVLGLATGSEGWSFAWAQEWDLVAAIRAPRTIGALLTGALLGLGSISFLGWMSVAVLGAALLLVLLLAADVAARSVVAPQELPVGLLTAVLGGLYLTVLLRRRSVL